MFNNENGFTGFGRRALLAAISMATVLGLVCSPPLLRAQSSATDWEKAAGGKMSFDVASVKQITAPGNFTPTGDFGLDESDSPGNTTLFSATIMLPTAIGFAYKLHAFERQELETQLPKWATSERFEIQARAASPSTKDQMRLMMQSLLADRFKLTVHWETRQEPSFSLVLVKAGKTGPQLQPHADQIPCQSYTPGMSVAAQMATLPGGLPAICGKLLGQAGPRGGNLAARNVTMAQFADAMSGGSLPSLRRPVIDKTGLTGGFDIKVSFALDLSPTDLQQFGPADIQSAFIGAFRDQLGLKLEPSTSSVDTLVIDHIDEPSPN